MPCPTVIDSSVTETRFVHCVIVRSNHGHVHASTIFPAKLVDTARQASLSEIQVDRGRGRGPDTNGADWDWLGSLAFVADDGLTAFIRRNGKANC